MLQEIETHILSRDRETRKIFESLDEATLGNQLKQNLPVPRAFIFIRSCVIYHQLLNVPR
jgi:hypothetical protein